MSFSGNSGGNGPLSGLTDAALSNPQTGHILSYNASLQKWRNNALGYVNVRDFGATASGGDDTSGIQAAINTLSTSGGTVYLPAGTYHVSATINVPSNIVLRGAGRFNTTLFKTVAGIALLNVSGTDSNNHVNGVSLEHLSLQGNALSGYLLQLHYASTIFVFQCSFDGCFDTAIDMMETFDSYFLHVTANYNLSATAPVIHIYNSATGTSNMIWFEQVRIEAFYYGAVKIESGPNSTALLNGFFFNQCKFETIYAGGDIIVATAKAVQLSMSQIFIAASGFAPGYSTPVNGINSHAIQSASFTDVLLTSGGSSTVCNAVLKVATTFGTVSIDNIYMDGPAQSSVIIFDGYSAGAFTVGMIGSSSGSPLTSGDASGRSTHLVPSVFNGIATVPLTVAISSTLSAGISTLRVNSPSPTTQTLPPSSTCLGSIFTIKNVNIGVVTISGQIDGASSYSLTSQYKYVQIQSNGSSYDIIANN